MISVGNTSSVDEYSSASALKTRFSDSDVTGNGLSDIVLSVSDNSKVYAGYSGFYSYGLKLGTSSYNGIFTLGLSREISKVVVHTAGWGASDSLQIGDAAAQTPGVAYSGNNAIKELTYIITASDSVTFTYAKRGFIQSIVFYAASGVVTPATYLNNASSYAKLTANETVTPGDSVTVSKTIAQLVGTPAPSNGTQYVEFELDTVITVSVNKKGDNGKIYNSGTEWRLYQSAAAVVTVSASNGATISSITFTFGTGNDGLLKYNDNAITSGSPVAISSLSSASFTVAKSTSGTNGQIKVTAISVTYGEKGSVSVDTVAMIFGANIPTNIWSAVNNLEDSEITDYGVMAFRTTEANLPKVSTVEQYFSSDPSNVSIIRKNSAVTPEEINGAYDFSVRIKFNGTSYYNVTYCVAPFIMVNDQYYFLPELRYSVNSLATYYKTHDGCDLSSDALDYLATTH